MDRVYAASSGRRQLHLSAHWRVSDAEAVPGFRFAASARRSTHLQRHVFLLLRGVGGLSATERKQVFIPFYRLPGETKGSGLGLSIARQIARLHGGDVIVMPQIDHGSCIRVTLPIA